MNVVLNLVSLDLRLGITTIKKKNIDSNGNKSCNLKINELKRFASGC